MCDNCEYVLLRLIVVIYVFLSSKVRISVIAESRLVKRFRILFKVVFKSYSNSVVILNVISESVS